ncbi:MAG: tight adherence protein [Desulfovibrionales bacterium]|nr:tight adherence protein [Desulfovibrionales bacterium]
MQAVSTLPVLASLAGCVSVFVAGFSVLGYLDGSTKAERLKERIQGRSRRREAPTLSRLGRAAAGMLMSLGRKTGGSDKSGQRRLSDSLVQAGIHSPNAVAVFQGVKIAMALCMGLAGLLSWWAVGTLPGNLAMLMAALPALEGYYIPDMWLSRKRKARQEAILLELPDALDLLVVCVESGMGLDQAIQRVRQELAMSAPHFSGELRQMSLELRAGKPRREALKNLGKRIGVDDVTSLVSLLIQADMFGVSIVRTLRVYSETLRSNRFQRAEEKAAKLSVKLLFPMLLCIFPAQMLVLLGPAGLKLFEVFGK